MSWPERLLLAKALALLPLTVAALRVIGFRRSQALLLPERDCRSLRQDFPTARAVARVVYGAAPWSPLSATCLPRALVLCRLLSQRGLQAELRLGVGKPDGEFAAHAWVEHGGVALAEPTSTEPRFAAFDGISLSRDA